jgi:hypothetical protein
LALRSVRNRTQRPHPATPRSYRCKPVYRAEGVYHLRYSLDGKRIWQPVGSDASLAQVALQRKTVELQAVNLGLAVPEPILPVLVTPEPVPYPAAKTDLRESIAEYLADTAARKTLYASLAP